MNTIGIRSPLPGFSFRVTIRSYNRYLQNTHPGTYLARWCLTSVIWPGFALLVLTEGKMWSGEGMSLLSGYFCFRLFRGSLEEDEGDGKKKKTLKKRKNFVTWGWNYSVCIFLWQRHWKTDTENLTKFRCRSLVYQFKNEQRYYFF